MNQVSPNQTDLFELLDSADSPVTAPVLGLADLGNQPTGTVGDGDNFFDVCLDASKGGIESITTIRMPCDTVRLVLPKGKPQCTDNSIRLETT